MRGACLGAGTAALVLALAAGPAWATRPLDTDDTDTNDPGVVSLELGADYTRNGGEGTALVTGLVAVGLFTGLELDVQGSLLLLDPEGAGPRGGPGDSLVFFRYRFLDEADTRPSLLGELTLRFPTGEASRGLGSPGIDAQLLLVGQKQVGPVVLLANVGYTFTASGSDLWFLSAAVRYPLTETWTLVGEVVGIVSAGSGPDTGLIRGGVAYQLTKKIALDAAVAGGLTRDSPDVVLRTGISIEF